MTKLRLSKYLLLILISSFISVFFILVNKTYSGIKETQDKILNIPQAKSINPKLDTEFLDLLESQDYFKPEDMAIISSSSSDLSSQQNP